jgi:hypothetical protein
MAVRCGRFAALAPPDADGSPTVSPKPNLVLVRLFRQTESRSNGYGLDVALESIPGAFLSCNFAVGSHWQSLAADGLVTGQRRARSGHQTSSAIARPRRAAVHQHRSRRGYPRRPQ